MYILLTKLKLTYCNFIKYFGPSIHFSFWFDFRLMKEKALKLKMDFVRKVLSKAVVSYMGFILFFSHSNCLDPLSNFLIFY